MDFLNGNKWVTYSNRCTRNVFSPLLSITYTEFPPTYQTRHFFNNFTTNEDMATKFEADLSQCLRNVTS